MRLWTLPFRLLGILALAALVSGAWLFRKDLIQFVRPSGTAAAGGPEASAGIPSPGRLARARDKVDSLHGWKADSVVLTAGEMAALVQEGLPRETRVVLDSFSLTLEDGRVSVNARLATGQIPRDMLGPLADLLDPWERITAAGPVVMTRPGRAEWRVDAFTLRDFTLGPDASRALMERSLPGARRGALALTLPDGVRALRVRPEGVALFPEEVR